ncbi:MAG: LapA family protein [Proteobacteria bacterium]|nr:LapA family protein [Pseudomonadota bacterium]MCP4917950.1 LapA family protein [Pseudomonadota bacterium]
MNAKTFKWIAGLLLLGAVGVLLYAFVVQNSTPVHVSWNLGVTKLSTPEPWPVAWIIGLSGGIGLILGRFWGWVAGVRKARAARQIERDHALTGAAADDDWV